MKNYFNAAMIACIAYCLAEGCAPSAMEAAKPTKQKSDTIVSGAREYNSCGSVDDFKQHTTNMYLLAIRDYIRLVKEEYNFTFDTLYFGRHKYGNPTDFPDIELPLSIDGVVILIITPEEGEKTQATNKSAFYINLFGSVNMNIAKFIFVAFSSGFKHQFDCTIQYRCDTERNAFSIESKTFENYGYSKN